MSGRTSLKTSPVMIVLLTVLAPAVAAGEIIYVDANTPDNNDGTNWANAYKYLQDGLAAASSGDEIWVAYGTYKPDANSADPNGSRDRNATFALINGVGIYGGFVPGGTWLERNPNIYETILSGYINTPGDINDNSYHVITSSGVNPNAIIDGFTITGGNANGGSSPNDRGGGMYNDNGSPTVIGCTFSGNSAIISGGGMHNEDGSPELTGCTFTDNAAESGGGIYNDSWDDPAAGNHVILTDCTFSGNSSIVAGGGMYSIYCDSVLTDCTFENNSTAGGIYGGGGLVNDRSNTIITRCSFNSNSVTSGAGGGFYNMDTSNATVMGSIFTGNSAFYEGSGIYNLGTVTVINCTFSGNSGHLYTHCAGGGMSNRGVSSTVINCKFKDNSAGYGGGMNNRDSTSVTIVNCTFSGNSAGIDGAGIYNRDCNPVIANCIIWGNFGEQIYNYYNTADPSVTYSCIQDGYPGTGNISINPMFTSSDLRIISPSPCIDAGNNDALPPDTLDLDNDYDTNEPVPFDLASKLRRVNDPAVEPDTGNAGTIGPPIVDMGAYEVSPIFVDDNAPSGGDGRSWATAFKYLQDAIYNAADPLSNRGEIRVAQGTYYPDQSEAGHVTPTDREASFELQNNLAIRGGYRGLGGGGSPNDRDITAFETILSGDYAGDDDPNDPNSYNENSYHVVSSNDTDASALLEGFTITAGNAANGVFLRDNFGGGIIILSGDPTIAYCTFSENSSHFHGGGLYNTQLSHPLLTNCSFRGNSTRKNGGGIYISNSEPVLTNCTFIGNSAYKGGGMYNQYYSTVSMQPTLTNCTFSGNTAYIIGGIGSEQLGTAEINLILTNCFFWGNSDSNGVGESAQIFTDPNVEVFAYYSCIQGCSTYCLDANDRNIGEDPLFLRDPDDGGDGWGDDPCTAGVDESLNDDYGDLRLTAGSSCVDMGNNEADTDASTPEIDPLPDTDLDGRPRFADGDCNDTDIVDMGAYEFTYAYIGDFDTDCDVEFVDFAILADYWLTDEFLVDIAPTPAGDGIIDRRDLHILCQNWLFGK